MTALARALKAGVFDDFWASPPEGHLGLTGAGIDMRADTAYHMSTVWRCINLVGGTFGATPLILYRRRPPDENGRSRGRDRATDRAEYRMLRLSPAPGMSAFRYRKTAMNHLLTWGNHYAEKVSDGFGQLRELHGLRPDRMRVRWADDGTRMYLYRDRLGAETRLPERKVFHVPGLGFDGLVGYAPLTLMRETIGSYVAARDFGASFFRHGARPAIVARHPKKMSPDAVDRLRAQLTELRGSGNAGKTVLMEEGADFKELGIPPEDAQFMESQRFYGVSETARWFGVPPHMVGDVERSTSWGSGIEEQKQGFIDFTMMDWYASFEQETAVQVLPADEPDIYAEFLLDAFLRGKTLERWQSYQIARNVGAFSPNDILDRENMNPREDEGGDEYLLPLSMESVGGSDGSQTTRTMAVVDPRTRRETGDGRTPEVTRP